MWKVAPGAQAFKWQQGPFGSLRSISYYKQLLMNRSIMKQQVLHIIYFCSGKWLLLTRFDWLGAYKASAKWDRFYHLRLIEEKRECPREKWFSGVNLVCIEVKQATNEVFFLTLLQIVSPGCINSLHGHHSQGHRCPWVKVHSQPCHFVLKPWRGVQSGQTGKHHSSYQRTENRNQLHVSFEFICWIPPPPNKNCPFSPFFEDWNKVQ